MCPRAVESALRHLFYVQGGRGCRTPKSTNSASAKARGAVFTRAKIFSERANPTQHSSGHDFASDWETCSRKSAWSSHGAWPSYSLPRLQKLFSPESGGLRSYCRRCDCSGAGERSLSTSFVITYEVRDRSSATQAVNLARRAYNLRWRGASRGGGWVKQHILAKLWDGRRYETWFYRESFILLARGNENSFLHHGPRDT